jgi:polysaccharide biosynthesis/export protein
MPAKLVPETEGNSISRRILVRSLILTLTIGILTSAQNPVDSQTLFLNQLGSGQAQANSSGVPQRRDPSSLCVDDYGNPADCLSVTGRYDYGIDGELTSPRYGIPPAASSYPSNYPYPSSAPGRDQPPYPAAYPNSPTYRVREPLTEFQRYVAASIGQVLPIFGASLFEQVPATFAPVDRVPVGPDYVIGPGDELQVTAWGQINFSRRLTVDRTGQIYLPDVGQILVAGLRYSQAAPTLRTDVARIFKNFDLSVTMGQLRSIQVLVVGEVRRPGSYTVSSLSTFVNALFASGGPSTRGSMRNIQLKHDDQTIRCLDLYDLLLHADTSQDAGLSSGDVILVPAAGPRAAIAGSIEHPGIYELNTHTKLGDLLELAGGTSPVAEGREVILERVAAGKGLQVQRIALNNTGLATKLQNGDIIRLLPVIPRFENAVTLRGNVADPGRFPWHPGMRLSDLIPNREMLLTRDYWAERNRFTTPETPLKDDTPNMNAPPKPDSAMPQIATTASIAPATNSRPELFSPAPDRALIGAPPGYREEARKTQGDSSLGAATGDDVPPLRSFLPRNLVQPSAPEIDWDYAVLERLDPETLSTRLIPFNLGKVVLQHDASEDLSLEPGDVVTIFSKADFSIPHNRQTKQIRIEGEVAMAGIYPVFPGDTLRTLVSRAGGLTSDAYLYGAQFTRESTRREQQKRYDDFLNQLEKDVNQGAANLSGRVISAEQAATAQGSVASQRELIDRLRRVPVNGRIVLDLAPASKGVNALPDVPLENGDRLYVPSRPLTVNVVGAVFEQAAFLYDGDLKVGDYLKKAGGPARSADRSHMFVIRADGAVVARTANVSLFNRGFESLPVYPGDTLVVPTYINRTTFVRGLMDWSQIFSNLALGAAAVNVLH